MKKVILILVFAGIIIIISIIGYLFYDEIANKNKRHNEDAVSFGGMKKHDSLALRELESNFETPNDFIILSVSGKDMDFDSDYKEGDSLMVYYYYRYDWDNDTACAIVLTYLDKAETICKPCNKKKFYSIYNAALEKNLTKVIQSLDSLKSR